MAAGLFTGSLLFSSCEKFKDFGTTNKNPAATTEPILSALLTNVESALGGYANMTTPGLYAQYFSETQYTDVSLYSLQQPSFTGYYSGVLYDLQNIRNRNESNNMSQVAKILQQYIFWRVTDMWGDVPYSSALKGSPDLPYDTQEEIYKGMIQALTEAVSSFDNSTILGDIVYGGNVAAWKRTANSLRMMMALQLSKKYPGPSEYAANEFKAALNDAGGYITDNSQNFSLKYPGGSFKYPWYATYDGRKDYAESKTMTDLLGSLGDPRINVFGGSTEVPGTTTSSNVGVPYGLAKSDAEAFTSANTNWARILRGDWRTDASTAVILSAGQLALARAEAANLGWTSENLTTVYQQGIALSFAQWGLPAPDAGYLNQSDVAVTPGGANNFKNISIQRYLAHYPDGLMGWDIWRKSGYPALTPAPAATNESKKIPRRYQYAPTEYTSNQEGVEAAAERIPGGDKQDSKVWWDQ